MSVPTEKQINDASEALIKVYCTCCFLPASNPKMSPTLFQYHWNNFRPIVQDVITSNKHNTDAILLAVKPAKKCILRDFAEYLI